MLATCQTKLAGRLLEDPTHYNMCVSTSVHKVTIENVWNYSRQFLARTSRPTFSLHSHSRCHLPSLLSYRAELERAQPLLTRLSSTDKLGGRDSEKISGKLFWSLIYVSCQTHAPSVHSKVCGCVKTYLRPSCPPMGQRTVLDCGSPIFPHKLLPRMRRYFSIQRTNKALP